MVWVDLPLNQVPKSSIVSDSSGKAKAPPQSRNIKSITNTNFGTAVAQTNLTNYEYFIRNLAAFGGYMQQTEAIFRATAMRMQTRLAEVTPDTPAVNLPVEFNNWLRGLLNTYNARYTSRLTNAWTFYSRKMDGISATRRQAVPQCFALYHAGKQAQAAGQVAIPPQTFNIANMIPPAPTLPVCNAPGTQGHVQWGLDVNGVAAKSITAVRILGAGRMDYYGLGNGTDFSKDVVAAKRFPSTYANCQNSWQVGHTVSKAGYTDVLLDMTCNGVNTNKVTAPMTFVVNNQPLVCVVVDGGQPTPIYIPVCDSTQAVATACANSVLQSNFPGTGSLLTGDMQFIPN
ncbi:hypothetical protein FB45DRAFT_804760 [Roridomyces roridus]|uniref:Uncharacterized protein n=1 Tax=Roridomyces roridus TaxID=1738132 RepID=A0AAD7F9A9_9AGAR|nr:hypothetical protein FB45DRAFT_804760 [Roridomyces roridus]